MVDPDFMLGSAEALSERRKKMLSLRGGGMGVAGVGYGLGAYGSPIGAVTGVQQPTAPPMGEQFPGGTPPTGDAGMGGEFAGGSGGGDGGGGGSAP